MPTIKNRMETYDKKGKKKEIIKIIKKKNKNKRGV
jgi:hypothetical protein